MERQAAHEAVDAAVARGDMVVVCWKCSKVLGVAERSDDLDEARRAHVREAHHVRNPASLFTRNARDTNPMLLFAYYRDQPDQPAREEASHGNDGH